MSQDTNLPLVSFIIPTLNSGRTLEKCLKSIAMQSYPKNKMEIIIADAGSADDTLSIIDDFKKSSSIACKLGYNELKTGEAGKSACIKASSGEILAFIDSDNELTKETWLEEMLYPIKNDDVFASEVLSWEYNAGDSVVDRYCALTGINDPICLFLGNYDRWSYLTGKWTGLKVAREEDKGSYLKVEIDPDSMPTMGANGFLIKKDILMQANYEPYYFDVDVMRELVKKGYTKIARPKIGIRHYMCDTISTYTKKQTRKIKDYYYFKTKKMRSFEYKIKSFGFIKFVIYTLLIFPLVLQSIHGFFKKKDWAWFFHPLACWITLIVYSKATIISFVNPQLHTRKGWRQ